MTTFTISIGIYTKLEAQGQCEVFIKAFILKSRLKVDIIVVFSAHIVQDKRII